MSENYIVINGKKAELTEEQLKALGIEEKIMQPFIKQKGRDYYYITLTGRVQEGVDTSHSLDDERYSVANYCTDKNLMEQRALHETLNRLLWRFACENGELENEWNDMNEHWSIYYSHNYGDFDTYFECSIQHQACVYFPTKEVAEKAIKEIIEPFMKEHPDFVWG